MTASATHRAIDAVWRIESARLIAGLARIVRDVGLAEDLAQEAFVAALEQWPESGVPDNPGAWLMATGKHRAVDRLRRAEVHERKTHELGRELALFFDLRDDADDTQFDKLYLGDDYVLDWGEENGTLVAYQSLKGGGEPVGKIVFDGLTMAELDSISVYSVDVLGGGLVTPMQDVIL